MKGTFNRISLAPSPGALEGVKMSNILKFHLQNQFQTSFVCLLTNKTYQMGFSFGRLGLAPGVGLWGI